MKQLKSPSDSDPRARPKPFSFYPPKINRLATALVKLGIRRSIKRKLKVTEIEIPHDDLERLRSLRGKRCLLTPSHSGGFEPHVIMYLAKLLDDDFNFVAAIELFEQSAVYRWLMPRLGVYSIIRGAVDRPSFSMTRELLAAGKRWLVIFPEGHTIWQNSMVIPFQEGVIQLAFKGYEDAMKQSADADLFCIPMAIKYVYLSEMGAEIDASLARLEVRLQIDDAPAGALRYERLRRIAEAVLAANERTQQVKPNPDSTLDDRIQSLKLSIVSQLEHELGLAPKARQTLLDRIRALFNAVDRIVFDQPEGSAYEQQLAAQRQQLVQNHYEKLWRLLQFVAIYDGYVKETMTVERFLDVLCLLEMEVFQERRVWGPRQAKIRVGAPINLKDRASAYATDRRSAVRNVTLELENSVRQMLEEMGRDCALVADD